jgi:hypothetical protein
LPPNFSRLDVMACEYFIDEELEEKKGETLLFEYSYLMMK